jgi:hypothetical protein
MGRGRPASGQGNRAGGRKAGRDAGHCEGCPLHPKARNLAKSLIDFLDGLEDTDPDAAIDDKPCGTDELEIAEGDDEPSLGSNGHGSGGPISYKIPVVSAGGEMIRDCEGDEHDGTEPVGDDEPSLGSIEKHCSNYGMAMTERAINRFGLTARRATLRMSTTAPSPLRMPNRLWVHSIG